MFVMHTDLQNAWIRERVLIMVLRAAARRSGGRISLVVAFRLSVQFSRKHSPAQLSIAHDRSLPPGFGRVPCIERALAGDDTVGNLFTEPNLRDRRLKMQRPG